MTPYSIDIELLGVIDSGTSFMLIDCRAWERAGSVLCIAAGWSFVCERKRSSHPD